MMTLLKTLKSAEDETSLPSSWPARDLAPMLVTIDGDRDEFGPCKAPALDSQQPLGSADSPIMLTPAGSSATSPWPSPSSKTASASTAVADA